MPSTKKRINLTIPDEVYKKLRAYMEENGVVSDATACLQLIVQQLRAQENGKIFMRYMQNASLEQLESAATEGAGQLKKALDKMPK